jgi:hypothetical protein
MSTTARGHGGLSRFLVFSSIALVPCCVVDGWRISPLTVIWAAGSSVRWYFGDHQVAVDSITFSVLNAYTAREGFKSSLTQTWEKLGLSPVVGLWLLISRLALPLVAIGLLLRWQASWKDTASEKLPEGCTEWTLPYPKARIFPCSTKHARMFPKRHSFEYSYLQCGFPVIPAGVTPDGTEIGLGRDRLLGSWWLRVRAEDYLERGNGTLGFYGKLRMYLRAQVCGDLDVWLIPYMLLTRLERQRQRVVTRLSCHSATLLRLRIQPCIILVHLRQGPPIREDHPGGEQHLWRTTHVLA